MAQAADPARIVLVTLPGQTRRWVLMSKMNGDKLVQASVFPLDGEG